VYWERAEAERDPFRLSQARTQGGGQDLWRLRLTGKGRRPRRRLALGGSGPTGERTNLPGGSW